MMGMGSVRVRLGESTLTLDRKATCRRCGQEIVRAAGSGGVWLHVAFVKARAAGQDAVPADHQAQAKGGGQ